MRKMKNSGIEWIGKIPEDWEVSRFKNVMHKEKVICEHYEGQDIISLTMNGVIKRDLENPSGKMPTTWDGYQFVEPEDLLLCLFDIDVTPRCVGLVKNKGLTSPAYSRFKVHKGYFNAYYNYLLRWIDDEKIFVHLSKNLRSSLTENDFGALYTIIPPLYEQQKIADFLDKKCSEIDSVISKTRETIEEYKKLKQSIITEVVTGKVKIEKGKVCGNYDTYKDSGVEWIGEIPGEWSVCQIKRFAKLYNGKEIENEVIKSDYAIDVYGSGGVFKYTTNYLYDGEAVLFGRKGSIGKPLIVDGKFWTVDTMYFSTCKQELTMNKFLFYLLKIFPWDVYTTKTALPSIVGSEIFNSFVPVPPLNSQLSLITFLDKKCSEIDALITKKEQLVVELEAYKKSLIYEVVTGKRRV